MSAIPIHMTNLISISINHSFPKIETIRIQLKSRLNQIESEIRSNTNAIKVSEKCKKLKLQVLSKERNESSSVFSDPTKIILESKLSNQNELLTKTKDLQDLNFLIDCLTLLVNDFNSSQRFDNFTHKIQLEINKQNKINDITQKNKILKDTIKIAENTIEEFDKSFRQSSEELSSVISHIKNAYQEKKNIFQMERKFYDQKKDEEICILKYKQKMEIANIVNEINKTKQLIQIEEEAHKSLIIADQNGTKNLAHFDFCFRDYSVKKRNNLVIDINELEKHIDIISRQYNKMMDLTNFYEQQIELDNKKKLKQQEIKETIAREDSQINMIQNWWRYVCTTYNLIKPIKKSKKKKNK